MVFIIEVSFKPMYNVEPQICHDSWYTLCVVQSESSNSFIPSMFFSTGVLVLEWWQQTLNSISQILCICLQMESLTELWQISIYMCNLYEKFGAKLP